MAFASAPELLRGEPYSQKTDLYQFGILLTEVLLPFGTASAKWGEIGGAVRSLSELSARCTLDAPSSRPEFVEVRLFVSAGKSFSSRC